MDFYKIHGELLSPRLTSMFTQCLEIDAFPPSVHVARITTLSSSYRPIALLNCELKILMKLLNTILSQVTRSLIDADQTDFMPRRFTGNNVHRLFTNIHAQHLHTGTRVVASLDINKAFIVVLKFRQRARDHFFGAQNHLESSPPPKKAK